MSFNLALGSDGHTTIYCKGYDARIIIRHTAIRDTESKMVTFERGPLMKVFPTYFCLGGRPPVTGMILTQTSPCLHNSTQEQLIDSFRSHQLSPVLLLDIDHERCCPCYASHNSALSLGSVFTSNRCTFCHFERVTSIIPSGDVVFTAVTMSLLM